LHSLVSGVMVMPASQVAGMLVAGSSLGLVQVGTVNRAGFARSWLLFPSLILCAGLLTLGVHELRTLPERSVQMKPGEDLMPRIWQDARVCRLYLPQNEGTK